MILDELYIAIRERLLDPARDLPIKQVDRFNDQPRRWAAGKMDGYALPAALVRFEPMQWQALGRRAYQCDTIVYVDVMQPGYDRMVDDATQTEEQRALQAYANVQAVAAHLNALRTPHVGTFTMVSMEQDQQYTQMRLDTIAFRTRLTSSNDLNEYVYGQPAPRVVV